HPGGALVLTAKEVDGTIEQKGSRWRRKGSGIRRFISFSGPQLGNPSMETDEAINRLEAHLADQQIEVDVEGAVVFLHPQVEFEIESPDYPVLHGEELASFASRLPAESPLSQAERERLLDVLRAGEVVVAPTQSTGRRRPLK